MPTLAPTDTRILKRIVVSVLCADVAGPYFTAPLAARVDAWSIDRNAYGFAGMGPVLAHPPCGPWGKLRGQCTRQDRHLAPFCLRQVQRCGGVLEHPAHSKLWQHAHLAPPGSFPDRFGGMTFRVTLGEFGSQVHKPTWLYCVGVDWPVRPPFRRGPRQVMNVHSAHRQLTPLAMATWLVDLAATTRN